MKSRRSCELCNGEAALHCESDSAFLCWACDARVHGANFLVARHARRLLCPRCGAFDADYPPVYGPGVLPVLSLCRSCGGGKEQDGGGSSSSDSESSTCSSSSFRSSMSSSCVSSVESGAAACTRERGVEIAFVPANGDGPLKAGCSVNSATKSECSNGDRTRRRRGRRVALTASRGELDARADVALTNWCRVLGLEGGSAVGAASHALSVGMRRMAAAPLRVCLAAAVWFSAKLCCAGVAEGGRRGAVLLRRLEACSGVPAKLIVAAEARLSRAVRCHVEEGEGWAECG